MRQAGCKIAPDLKAIAFGEIVAMMEKLGPDPETADAIEAEIKKARQEQSRAQTGREFSSDFLSLSPSEGVTSLPLSHAHTSEEPKSQ